MKKVLSVLILITIIITIGACTLAPEIKGKWISEYPYIEFDLDEGTGFMDVDGKRIEIHAVVNHSNVDMSIYDRELAERSGYGDEARFILAKIKEKKDVLHLKIHHYKGEEVDVEIVMKKVES